MRAPTTVCGLSILDEWIDEIQEQALLAAVDASPWRNDLARQVQRHGFPYDYAARSTDASMRFGPHRGTPHDGRRAKVR